MMFYLWCLYTGIEPDEAALRAWLSEVNQRYVAEHIEAEGRHISERA